MFQGTRAQKGWEPSWSRVYTIDKRNQQLKFKVWDVNKPTETDSKVVGLNLDLSKFFID